MEEELCIGCRISLGNRQISPDTSVWHLCTGAASEFLLTVYRGFARAEGDEAMSGRSTAGSLSERAGGRLAEQLGTSADTAKVYAFAFQLVGGFLLSLVALAAVSWAAGVLVPALTACAAGATMRMFAGGAHSRTPAACAAVGAFICTAAGLAGRALAHTYSVQTLLIGFCVLLPWILFVCLRRAPAATAAKPIPPRRRGYLRLGTLALVGGWACWSFAGFPGASATVWSSGTLGLTWQVFSLTPAGFRFAQTVDEILSRGGVMDETQATPASVRGVARRSSR